ncbi:hypothetical protein C0J52_02202 [Blattella germanica]|nr:hypothetical protein C0J52_02202 [Blattella germanica]
MANYFAFNGGIEKFYMYEDKVKNQLSQQKFSDRRIQKIDALDKLYDPHFVNWFVRLVAADKSLIHTFLTTAEKFSDLAGLIPAMFITRNSKVVFRKLFMGNEEKSEGALQILTREMLRANTGKLMDEILQLGIVIHQCLYKKPQLFHVLMDYLMSLVENAEKSQKLASVWGTMDATFPGKYKHTLDQRPLLF